MKKLQEVTDYKVISFFESIKALDWEYTDNGESFTVTCDCENSKVRYSGFIGTEIIACESCGKQMVDLFSPLPTGTAVCSVLSVKDFEVEKDADGNDRYWIAIDGKGGIKAI